MRSGSFPSLFVGHARVRQHTRLPAARFSFSLSPYFKAEAAARLHGDMYHTSASFRPTSGRALRDGFPSLFKVSHTKAGPPFRRCGAGPVPEISGSPGLRKLDPLSIFSQGA